MDGIEIRPIREDEFPAILALVCVAFGEGATEEDAKAYRAGFPFDRSLCAFEEGRLVASSGVLSMELTLPGGSVVPMG
ncbi:MAG: GNAT family N-acetyltransferase, partial [Actinobacteria bacterium]|nr:GNAT family N-acetyltransferase [Actinomycetota bacterium]